MSEHNYTDNGDTCYCGDRNCQNYVSTMLNEREHLRKQVETDVLELARLQQRLDRVQRNWDTVETGLKELIEDGTITGDGMLEEFLLEQFDLEVTDEVEVTVTLEVTLTVKRPKDEGLTYNDFWFDQEPSLECNYEILEQTAVISDVSE